MIEYENAYRIRSSNIVSAECRNLVDLIHELYHRLKLYLETYEFGDGKKPLFLIHLKKLIEDKKIYWDERPSERIAIEK